MQSHCSSFSETRRLAQHDIIGEAKLVWSSSFRRVLAVYSLSANYSQTGNTVIGWEDRTGDDIFGKCVPYGSTQLSGVIM
jgi:hypothetical protein